MDEKEVFNVREDISALREEVSEDNAFTQERNPTPLRRQLSSKKTR